MEMKINQSILENIKERTPARLGFLVCDAELLYADDATDTLTYALQTLRHTYLAFRHELDRPALFVHFTREDTAKKILKSGFSLDFQSEDSDYYDVLCCFRVSAMSRGFQTAVINTAVVFTYSGPYYSVVRQDDTNSNIGYCLIPKEGLERIRVQHINTMEQFELYKNSSAVDIKQVALHHGLRHEDLINPPMCYKELSHYLPKEYERIVYGVDD